MAKYRVIFKKSAAKELKKLDEKTREKIAPEINKLAENARPSGCRKIRNKNLYRITKGVYRVIYSIEDDVLLIEIIRVRHRKSAYRNL